MGRNSGADPAIFAWRVNIGSSFQCWKFIPVLEVHSKFPTFFCTRGLCPLGPEGMPQLGTYGGCVIFWPCLFVVACSSAKKVIQFFSKKMVAVWWLQVWVCLNIFLLFSVFRQKKNKNVSDRSIHRFAATSGRFEGCYFVSILAYWKVQASTTWNFFGLAAIFGCAFLFTFGDTITFWTWFELCFSMTKKRWTS